MRECANKTLVEFTRAAVMTAESKQGVCKYSYVSSFNINKIGSYIRRGPFLWMRQEGRVMST